MSMHFRALAEQAMADGAISAEELLSLRQDGWADGRFDPEEAEAIFVINDHLACGSAEWTTFFVEAVSEFLVNGSAPKGYVDAAQAAWLIDRIDHDGKLDSLNELELLARILEKAVSVPDSLKTYALTQIEAAVLTGAGPTRDGGALDAGCINAVEARLLRRFIFAAGGDRPAAVSRNEAEFLFRIKDAALGSPNAAEWKQLFVQGVGNYLQGFGGKDPLAQERAAELESFMNNSASSIGGFIGRMMRSDVNEAVASTLRGKSAARDLDADVAAAHSVTDSENLWLQARLDADNQLDEFEQALLAFLAEE